MNINQICPIPSGTAWFRSLLTIGSGFGLQKYLITEIIGKVQTLSQRLCQLPYFDVQKIKDYDVMKGSFPLIPKLRMDD